MRDFSENFDPSRGIYDRDDMEQCDCSNCREDREPNQEQYGQNTAQANVGQGSPFSGGYGEGRTARLSDLFPSPVMGIVLDHVAEPPAASYDEGFEDGAADVADGVEDMATYLEGFAEGINHAVALMRLAAK